MFIIKTIATLIILLSYFGCSQLAKTRDGIFLIPKGYVGDVIILFEQPNGVMPEVEDGQYVYKIPKDGILRVRSKRYEGVLSVNVGNASFGNGLRYFYIDEDNKREEVKYLRITGDRDVNGNPKDKFDGQINQGEYENGIFIMNHESSNFDLQGRQITLTNFTIGNPKNSSVLYANMNKRISDLQRRN
ncbi:MAG: hypothetical protein WBD16_00220 [Pyrinomonadaceae bacterium]